MSKPRAKLLTLAIVGGLGLAAWKIACVSCCGDAEATSARYLENRAWIERMPQNDRDVVNHVLVLKSRDGRFGAAGRSSAWRHMIEIFRWQREENRLTLEFPQERVRAEFVVRTWECEDEAPAPFELCLELSRQGRAVRFYSRHDWVVEPHVAIEARREALAEASPEAVAPLLQRMVELTAPPSAGPAALVDAAEGAAWALLRGE